MYGAVLRISYYLAFVGLLMIGLVTLAAAKGNVLVGRCYTGLPCSGTGSEIYWDPYNKTEGYFGGKDNDCALFKNVYNITIKVAPGKCKDFNTGIDPGQCVASAAGPWERLCP